MEIHLSNVWYPNNWLCEAIKTYRQWDVPLPVISWLKVEVIQICFKRVDDIVHPIVESDIDSVELDSVLFRGSDVFKFEEIH